MGMTSGERSALWRKRQRENPNLHQQYKEKENERYLKRKESGHIKSVKDMNAREKRKTRRNCKYGKEIQSMHFGASQRQISIHTGVAYLQGTATAFSTISDCLKHSPPAIWAHLNPVLQHMKTKSSVDSVHFVSDGPTTQYRSRSNFFLFSIEIIDMGFKYSTWNFLEAGHGKGAPDGVGATIKRHADQLVNSKGMDVMCAADLMDGLKDTTSKLMFEIKEEAVANYERQIANVTIPAVPETMKMHQATVVNRGLISSRPLSCFCFKDCECYSPVLTCMSKNVSHENPGGSSGGSSADVVADDFIQSTNDPFRPLVLSDSLIGSYCVVDYEGLPYPGLIMDVDEDTVEVTAMCRIGPNRFFWPLVEDRLWYGKEKLITLLEEEPALVTKRHRHIDSCMWKRILEKMGLDEAGKKAL
ncbi:uncharacterized protein LOC128215498 [Mya arenaria]|uniref:uncharacterized protein LOC128215498 n=1 Tax=Mya arenaria TaxID=6604 RepID=UPI0022E2C03F|nr:uncharacterized protein LOC128215498 [Mya arenaria]